MMPSKFLNLDTDSEMTENSDYLIPSQKAVKTALSNKANIDADNFSTTGKSTLSGLGMPSSNYIDLTVGASGSTYNMVANGWLSWYCNQNNNGYIFVQNSSNGLLPIRTCNSSNDIAGFMPVCKGDSIYIEYSNLSFNRLRFHYAEGENN